MKNADGLNIALGNTIRETRIKKGFTQEDLAEKCDTSAVYISEIERGIKSPTFTTVFTIATALEMKMSEFVLKLEERITYRS